VEDNFGSGQLLIIHFIGYLSSGGYAASIKVFSWLFTNLQMGGFHTFGLIEILEHEPGFPAWR